MGCVLEPANIEWCTEGAWARLRDGRVGVIVREPDAAGYLRLRWGDYGVESHGVLAATCSDFRRSAAAALLSPAAAAAAAAAEAAPTEREFQQRLWGVADPRAFWLALGRGTSSSLLGMIREQCSYRCVCR